METLAANYLSTVVKRVSYYKDLADKAMAPLSTEQLHFQATSESNSIAVIVQHMAGNMLSRWTNFLTEDGEKEWRMRDAEFEEQRMQKEAVIALWEKGWDCYLSALRALQPDDLMKTVTIRNEGLTVTDAINRQLAHYPYHIGQIIFISKMLQNENWKSLSIPKGGSERYNSSADIKDPAKKYQ